MAYLIHFNKNHDPKNGRFTFGDGDLDGISDDHHNYAKNKQAQSKNRNGVTDDRTNRSKQKIPKKARAKISRLMERDFGYPSKYKDDPRNISLKELTKNTDDKELFYLALLDNVQSVVLSDYKGLNQEEAEKLVYSWSDTLYNEAYSK